MGRQGCVDEGLTIEKLLCRLVDAQDEQVAEDRLAQVAPCSRPHLLCGFATETSPRSRVRLPAEAVERLPITWQI